MKISFCKTAKVLGLSLITAVALAAAPQLYCGDVTITVPIGDQGTTVTTKVEVCTTADDWEKWNKSRPIGGDRRMMLPGHRSADELLAQLEEGEVAVSTVYVEEKMKKSGFECAERASDGECKIWTPSTPEAHELAADLMQTNEAIASGLIMRASSR